MSGDVTLSVSSNPSGNPASTAGNLMTRVSIWYPNFLALWVTFLIWGALDGVVMMVDLTPLVAKRMAKSMKGIVWP